MEQLVIAHGVPQRRCKECFRLKYTEHSASLLLAKQAQFKGQV